MLNLSLIIILALTLINLATVIYHQYQKPKQTKTHTVIKAPIWDPLPEFSAKITDRDDVIMGERRRVHLKLEITNYGLENASQVELHWDPDDKNYFEWTVIPDITEPINFGTIKHKENIVLELICDVPILNTNDKIEHFFAFFALEMNFVQNDGEPCTQVITWFDYGGDFDWLDSGFVKRG